MFSQSKIQNPKSKIELNHWLVPTALTLASLALVMGVRGKLQEEELRAYDAHVRNRPAEPADERIVIVGITEADIQKIGTYPFDDLTYAKVLERIKAAQPRAIGFDIIRDQPVEPGHDQLVQIYRTTPNLIGIGKFTGTPIPPPPELEKLGQFGDASGIIDADGVVRRAYLYPPTHKQVTSPPSFPLALAATYLHSQPQRQDGRVQLAQVQLSRFQGYGNQSGFPILINWRSRKFPQVSFTKVLDGQVNPDLFRNRLVLVGATTPSLKDTYFTPYSHNGKEQPVRMYGVEIIANITSQLISAAEDGRSELRVTPDWLDYPWLLFWTLLASLGVWSLRRLRQPVILLLASCGGFLLVIAGLQGTTYWLLVQSWWLPSVAPLLGIGLGTGLTLVGVLIWQRFTTLEQLVEERTQQLQAAQSQLIAQERLVFLGRLVGGINHELKNRLVRLNRHADSMSKLLEELREESEPNERAEIKQLLDQNLNALQLALTKSQALTLELLPKSSATEVEPTPTDLNQLAANCFRLVATNRRRTDPLLGLQYEEDFDSALPALAVVPQDLTFVLISLMDNAWDALSAKQKQAPESYQPRLEIGTKNWGCR